MDVSQTGTTLNSETKETAITSPDARRSIQGRLHAFIENYAQCGRVHEACRAAGINHNTHYRKLQSDPEYRAAVERAEQSVAQQVEDKVFDLAMDGELQAAIVLLKRFRPQLYRERASLDVSGEIDLVTALSNARNRMIAIDADSKAS